MSKEDEFGFIFRSYVLDKKSFKTIAKEINKPVKHVKSAYEVCASLLQVNLKINGCLDDFPTCYLAV